MSSKGLSRKSNTNENTLGTVVPSQTNSEIYSNNSAEYPYSKMKEQIGNRCSVHYRESAGARMIRKEQWRMKSVELEAPQIPGCANQGTCVRRVQYKFYAASKL
jgi:hypothetical protein